MTVETATKAPTWDLDSLFPGATDSKEFEDFRKNINTDLKTLTNELEKLPPQLDDSNRQQWLDYILKIQDLTARVFDAESFAHCLVTQNVKDEKAHQIVGEIDVYVAAFKRLLVQVEAFAKNQPDDKWNELLDNDALKEGSFFLNELREIARKKMPPEFESLAAELAVNGYHAWNRLYDKMYGELGVDFSENGKTEVLSLGQLANKMTSADRDIRKQAFEKLEAAWETRSTEASMALNFQAGFRLTLYEKRNWNSVVFEPLLESRISEATLNAMWSAVAKAEPKIQRYIEAKKKLTGINNFRWYDQAAPVGASDRKYSFDEASGFIVDKLAGFNQDQADFTRMALDKRWVEAEYRAGKAGGAFCTSLSTKKESRVLMTFEGTFDNLLTLAHELGHAYHQQVVCELPVFAQVYPMTLAETASIFNEMLVADAALMQATERDEKLMLLDQKLQNAYTLFCNINARFIFDKTFYEERKNGLVSRARLDEIMVDSQKKSFMGTLADDGYHKLFWASKLHFFLTDTPFYNFPYTFGFLFASGVYNRAKTEGKAFAPKYRDLLADTGKMTSEDVARKHMNVDLTKEDFWTEAVNRVMSDVEEFEKLVG